MGPPMKKFLLTLTFLIVLTALGILAWSNFNLHRKLDALRGELAQLERERRELQRQVSAQQRDPKPEEQTDERKRIEQQTGELRGLPFKSPVNYKMIERGELRRLLVDKVRQQYTEQELRDYSRSLATLGLIPEGTDLFNVIVSLYGEQVAAFYQREAPATTQHTWSDLAASDVDTPLFPCLRETTHSYRSKRPSRNQSHS